MIGFMPSIHYWQVKSGQRFSPLVPEVGSLRSFYFINRSAAARSKPKPSMLQSRRSQGLNSSGSDVSTPTSSSNPQGPQVTTTT